MHPLPARDDCLLVILHEPAPHECIRRRQSDGVSVDALALHADKPVPKCLIAYLLPEEIADRAELVFDTRRCS